MTKPVSANNHNRDARIGAILAIAAYLWWGSSALYFKLLTHVPPTGVLAHRIVWSALLLAAIIAFARQWPQVIAAVRNRRILFSLALSTLLLSTNWLIFIYSIASHRLVEASLGYFVNPLFTVVLGVVLLRERLRSRQWLATAIAAGALAYLTVARGGLPWIALALPLSFGSYSVVRKRLAVDALPGLFIETALLAPPALVYLLLIHTSGAATPINTAGTLAILSLSGIVTALPLLWFVAASKRLPLSTIGFLQYLNPTMQFLVAVALFGEPLGQERLIAFALIWIAVGLFVVDALGPQHFDTQPAGARSMRLTRTATGTAPARASGRRRARS